MDPLTELRVLRERLAELEQLAAQEADRRGPIYQDATPGLSVAQQNERLQDELAARAWQYDEQMEAVLARLDKDRDDVAVTPGLRVSAALYRAGKYAARRHGIDTRRGNE